MKVEPDVGIEDESIGGGERILRKPSNIHDDSAHSYPFCPLKSSGVFEVLLGRINHSFQ